MGVIKPSIPKGTRDFSPLEVARRTYIFDTIRSVFRTYGYQPIETPTMENLSTLTGKYGDEGDKLIFKILNSGDFFAEVQNSKTQILNSKEALPLLVEKALRYDLTVPFARYVVMHQNDIKLPFKRYQIQPVWRADRPQKGRYREFYQCDADVVGSKSLLNEAEFVMIYDEVFRKLNVPVVIKINNRKLLDGLAELIGAKEQFMTITIALDKLDKIGWDGVGKEMMEAGISEKQFTQLRTVIDALQQNQGNVAAFKDYFRNSEIGKKGIEELESLYSYLDKFAFDRSSLQLDITLARGLNYYTGTIFEVQANAGTLKSSIGGGGRYDDLTGMFGLKNLTGVGISFGADRIYDVVEELGLFPENSVEGVQVLITNAEAAAEDSAIQLLKELRTAGIASELFHELQPGAFGKQLKYANDKNIPYVVVIGSTELQEGKFLLKQMQTGEQQLLLKEELIQQVRNA